MVYEYEPETIEESFADIFGFMVERFAEQPSGTLDWDLGEDRGSIIRRLSDPNFKNQPDTYKGNFWFNVSNCTNPNANNDFCGVHKNSGVMNFWFYLLANGGSGINDNGDPYQIFGIGIDKAAGIAFHVLTSVLQSNAQPTDVRAATINYAELIYGQCKFEAIQVKNAWAAVGVGNPSTCPNVALPDELSPQNQVYPNPVKDKLTIEFDETSSPTLKIFGSSGELLRTWMAEEAKSVTLDLSMLPAGFYFLQLNNQNHISTTKLIVE